MRLTATGHEGWLVGTGTGTATLAVDPVLGETGGTSELVRYPVLPARHIALDAFPELSAVVLTGHATDRTDLWSLHQLDRRIPVFVSPLFAPAVSTAIEMLGFAVHRMPVDRPFLVAGTTLTFHHPAGAGAACQVTIAHDGVSAGLAGALPMRATVLIGSKSEADLPAGGGWSLPATEFPRELSVGAGAVGAGAAGAGAPRAGDSWILGAGGLRPAERASWAGPPRQELAVPRLFAALCGPFASDAVAQEGYELVHTALADIGRELTLYPLTGHRLDDASVGTGDGLGPKSVLLTFVGGPGGTRCQFALDVTRAGFVPARVPLDEAVQSYPAGVVLHLADMVGILGSAVHVEDVAAAAMQVWNREGAAAVVTARWCEVLGTAARPALVERLLMDRANDLKASFPVEYLLDPQPVFAVGHQREVSRAVTA